MPKARIDSGHYDVQTHMHFHTDAYGNDKMTIENTQDCEPIIEMNKKAQNYYANHKQTGELREVAEIPTTIIFKWLKEEGLDIFSSDPDMQNRLRKKLDSREWSYLRTDNTIYLGTR